MGFLIRALALAVVGIGLMVPAVATEPDPVSTVEEFVVALSHADLDALLSHVARDATVFAPLSSAPRRVEGREDIAALFEPFFARILENAGGHVEMNLVPLDLKVQVLGDVAVVTFHLGQVPDEPLAESYSFSRRTFVLRLAEGQWKIVHFHGSNVIIPPQAVESG